ncbi:unnamed protein product [Sphagnum balticum]
MKPGDRRKDKVQHHTSLYRSVSSPGIVSSYEKDTEKREEVVVGGYGLPPIHSPSPDGISSSSPAMAINHPGYQQQERGLMGVTTTTTMAGGGSKGRKRPGRKTRQAVDGYGSSPDAHGTSPPYRNDNMKGGYKIQAEQVDKEAPVRGTNNYASLLSSPSPSSIPNPTFTTKYAYDFHTGLPAMSRASVSQQSLFTIENNHHVQLNLPPPSPSFLSNSDIHSVKMNSTTVSSMSPRFDGSRRESLNLLGVSNSPNDFSGNGYVDLEEPTSPVANLMPGFLSELALNSLETNSRASTPKDVIVDMSLSPRIDLENGRLPNPSLSVGPPRSLSEEDPVVKSSARQLPAIGVLKANVKSASKTSKGIPNITLLRRNGSSFGSPRKSGIDGIQPGSAPMRSTSPAKLYPEHWSPEEVNKAMEEGQQVFYATLRVNSHNRSEAYVTIDGIPLDILIEGSSAQNRAIEGDVVAVLLDQPSAWPRLKGGNIKQMSNESRSLGEAALKHTETEKGIVHPSSGLGDDMLNCDSLQDQHAMGFSSMVHTESTRRDLGHNGFLPQLQQRSKDIRSWNHIQKDSGGKGSSYWQESSTIKSSGYGSGQLDPRVEAARKSVVRILRRPSNESTPGAGQSQQNGFESRTDIGEGWTGGGSGIVLASTDMENKDAARSSGPDISGKVAKGLPNLESLVGSLPGKRPSGKVVAILEKSFRRETVVGFLEFPQHAANKCGVGRGQASNLEDSPKKRKNLGLTMLVPVDNRWPKMIVFPASLPNNLRQRLKDNDPTVCNELLAARVDGWRTDSYFPVAVIKQTLGQGGELDAQQKAILHEHAISSGNFSTAALACLPKVPWKIPVSEMKRRKNLLHLRIFSVDHSTAQGCSHALSIESFPDGAVRVGIHVTDVSYFVQPQTALDQEVQTRSTSVSFIQHMLPMLPRLLCEDLCSLNPAVDRLAFSVMWDMNSVGDITNEWIGRTVVRSCAKLTYGHVQSMMMEEACHDSEGIEPCEDILGFETGLPEVYGGHKWTDLVKDIRSLHRIAQNRRASRFQGGALKLDHTKLVFTLEEDGTPYESTMYNTRDSNLVVKEFLLLANMTVARAISNAFPDSALLRRHPEPSLRKLKEFEDFCSKIGFDLDSTSAGTLHTSLMKMQESVKHDPVLYSILMQYASKPMQSAKYFCSGEFKDKEDWAHYAHAIPLYTHFTSPLHRYPDIIVHRTLAAALEAEEASSSREAFMPSVKANQAVGVPSAEESMSGVFTNTLSERGANSVPVSKQALAFAAMKHKLPGSSELTTLAARCNERRMASRSVKEASIKLNIWTLLKKNKQGLLSDARVLALGPKFMSLYICKFAMERRIYYEDIEGVTAEWFEATGTLVLDISSSKNIPQRRANQSRNGRPQRTVADIATLVNPTDSSSSSPEQESYEDIIREVEERLAGRVFTDGAAEIPGCTDHLASDAVVEPTVFPLTLRQFSSVPVSLHAIGGDNRALDFAARLYVSSYTSSG